jgi:hypothetical protein
VTESTISDLLDQVSDIQSLDDISSIPWASEGLEQRLPINLLTPMSVITGLLTLGTQWANLNIASNLIDGATANVSQKLDEVLKWLCQGFELGKGGCQGIPVPFNQAFLAPGQYHLFWCVPKLPNPLYIPFKLLNQTLGKGLPILSFPTNATPFVRPPNPAGAGGIFQGETSQFRLYLAVFW